MSKLNVLKLILTAFVGPFCQRENLPTKKTLAVWRPPSTPVLWTPAPGFQWDGRSCHNESRPWTVNHEVSVGQKRCCCMLLLENGWSRFKGTAQTIFEPGVQQTAYPLKDYTHVYERLLCLVFLGDWKRIAYLEFYELVVVIYYSSCMLLPKWLREFNTPIQRYFAM